MENNVVDGSIVVTVVEAPVDELDSVEIGTR